MKKSNLISIQNLLMAFAIIFTLTCTVGCKKDGCTDPNATNYDSKADEDDGSCILPGCTNQFAENYDATANEDDGSCTLERVKFIGSYTTIEVCGGGNDSYTLTILESSAGDNKVIINNLFNGDGSVTATIDGTTIDIDNELDTTSGVTFDGSGELTGNKLDLSFTVSSAGDADNCSLDGTKQ